MRGGRPELFTLKNHRPGRQSNFRLVVILLVVVAMLGFWFWSRNNDNTTTSGAQDIIARPKSLSSPSSSLPPSSSHVKITRAPLVSATVADLKRGDEVTLDTTLNAADGHDDLFDFTIATVPRAWDVRMPELKYIQSNSVNSWLSSGAREALWMTPPLNQTLKNGVDLYDISGVMLWPRNRGRVPRIRRVPKIRTQTANEIPLVSDAFRVADAEARTPFVVFMNCDIFVAPSLFGRTLRAVLRTMRTSKRFLVVGHRIRVPESPEVIESVLLGSPEDLWKRWIAGATEPNPHAVDLFVWRKGTFTDETFQMPDFLIGRNIWDLWIWSYAVRHWDSVQGGNALFVLHPDHQKPGQEPSEYNENSSRANAIPGEGVSCSHIACADYFLYRGQCRSVDDKEQHNVAMRDSSLSKLCMRRKKKEDRQNMYPDEKISLSKFGVLP